MPIAKFAYNNVKNAYINYILFKLNFNYYFYNEDKKDINLIFKLKTTNKLAKKLKKFIET